MPTDNTGPIHLSAIGTALGELALPIEGLRDEPGGRDFVPLFLQDGFKLYRKTERPASALLARAVQASLDAGNLDPAAIDAVVICAENFEEFAGPDVNGALLGVPARRGIAAALSGLGISAAYLGGWWSAGCANFVSGISLARGMVDQGTFDTVLVVTVDSNRRLVERIMNNGEAVYSDGASCCVVSRQIHGAQGYRIAGAALAANVSLAAIDSAKNAFAYLLSLNRAIATARPGVERRLGRPLNSYGRVVAPNLRRRSLSILAESFQLPLSRFEMPLKDRVAHVAGADHLLALECELHGEADPDPTLLLFNPGPFAWNFMELVRTHRSSTPPGSNHA